MFLVRTEERVTDTVPDTEAAGVTLHSAALGRVDFTQQQDQQQQAHSR